MAQEHFDRLTALDASFLEQEGPTSHMHVGAVAMFENPVPDFDQFLDTIRGRLHLVPRYRQKLSIPPMRSGRPVWVDDPSFNIEYHVRRTALPPPGSEEQLLLLTSRIFSQQLDRSKPLWEMWIIEGLEDDRWALINKTHHAMIDGVSGVDLATVIFDLSPEGTVVEHPPEPWMPAPEPGDADLFASGSAGRCAHSHRQRQEPHKDGVEPRSRIRWPSRRDRRYRRDRLGRDQPGAATPLNVEIGPHRRFRVVKAQLEDFKQIKNALGGTVNDAVLTVVSGALRTWLQSRGVRTEGLELRALVPVSIRPKEAHHEFGNQIAAMRGPLPVYIDDPIARLGMVRQSMDGLKESKQALGAEVISEAQNFAPPTLLAQASRLNFSTRLFNLIVTNVPGPQFPLYVGGSRLLSIVPVAFLPRNHALAIAIMSYDGGLSFGLLGDYDQLHDIDVLADALQDSIDELLALSAEAAAAQ